MTDIEATLRTAAEQCRRVVVRYEGGSGSEYERELEPYVVGSSELVAFEYLENCYRSYPLSRILAAEVTPRSFMPRRPIEVGATDPRRAARDSAEAGTGD
jgi:predicted DNA-binding transcriptional regulator YafY